LANPIGLKLSQALAMALVVPTLFGLTVAEYAANLAKKTLTGTGHAEKSQIAMTVGILVPGSGLQSADAALMRSPWQSPMPHTGIAP
jgi:crossover junction endodeoxyribonuclease RuvC